MRHGARAAIALVGAAALIAACGNGNGEDTSGGGGSSGSSSGLSGGSSGGSSGLSGSSSGGFNGPEDSSLPRSDDGSDDGPGGNSNPADTGAEDRGSGDSGGASGLDANGGDGAGAMPDGGSSGADAGNGASLDAGHDAGNGGPVDAGHDAGNGSGADAGHGSADAGADSGGVDAGHDAGNGGVADAGHDAGNGGSTPTMIPTPTATCPTIPNTGTGSSVLTYAGNSITVWAGAAPVTPGPLVIYWFATGGTPAQAVQALGGQAGINKITGLGGVVVAPNATTKSGNNTGDNVWYTGDVAQVDEVVACAVQEHRVDPRHIHVLGYSAGALQTVYMWFARSGYVASVLSYSGGDLTINKTTMQDPSNIPAAVVAHGAMGMDTFGAGALSVDFYNASHTWETDIKNANGFDIDCNDGSTHGDETTRFKIAPEGVQFFLDHPFKASPDPYAGGLSSAWPSYCTIANP